MAASGEAIHALLHGWSGLALAYGAIEGPMLAGMLRVGAVARRLWLSPILAAPVTVAAGVATTLTNPIIVGLGAAPDGLAQMALAGAMSVAFGYLAGRRLGRPTPGASGYQRGAIVLGEQAAEQPRSRIANRSDPILTLAGVPLSISDETKHFKFIGTTGTGKSTAISELLAGALKRGDRAVVADPDSGYLRQFYDERRGDVILNPFEPRSRRWDLFAEIRAAYDVDQLARSLIPDHDGAERSWRGYARTFFAAVTQQACAAGVRDLSELYRLLVVADTAELRTLTGGTAAQPFLNEHNSRMFDSLRSVASSAVAALEYVATQRAPPLSVRDWVANADERQRGVLFLPYKAGQIATLRSMISAWMRIGIFEAMESGTEQRPLWFVVDELDALGPIDGLKDALARVRKFGGRCVLGLQSIAQVASIYGSGDAHTIVENCGNSLLLRCSSSEGGGTSRFASGLIGQRQVLRTTLSTSQRPHEWFGSTTRSEHLSIEPAVMDAEIEQLPDLMGFLKVASRPEWQRVVLKRPSVEKPQVVAAPGVPVSMATASAALRKESWSTPAAAPHPAVHEP